MCVTVDDLVAFQRHCITHRPVGRKGLMKVRLRYLLSVVLATPLAWSILGRVVGTDAAAWTTALLVVGLAAFVWFGTPSGVISSYRQGLAAKMPTGATVPCQLFGDPWGLCDHSFSGVFTRYAWAAIEGIDETPEHAFIWVGSGKAVVIPKRIGADAVRSFLEMVKAATVQARWAQEGAVAYQQP